jgi:hypothetical protein
VVFTRTILNGDILMRNAVWTVTCLHGTDDFENNFLNVLKITIDKLKTKGKIQVKKYVCHNGMGKNELNT